MNIDAYERCLIYKEILVAMLFAYMTKLPVESIPRLSGSLLGVIYRKCSPTFQDRYTQHGWGLSKMLFT